VPSLPHRLKRGAVIVPHQPETGKEVREIPQDYLQARFAEAWALIRKGDQFGIGRRFLNQHAIH
jgi:hypothetical protein